MQTELTFSVPHTVTAGQSVLRIIETDPLKSPVLFPPPYDSGVMIPIAFIMSPYEVVAVCPDQPSSTAAVTAFSPSSPNANPSSPLTNNTSTTTTTQPHHVTTMQHTRHVAIMSFPPYRTVHLPLASIESFADIGGGAHRDFHAIELQSKHLWSWRIGFRSAQEQRGVLMWLENLKARQLKDMFAFDYFRGVKKHAGQVQRGASTNYGWSLYDIGAELDRQTMSATVDEEKLKTPGIGTNLRPFFRIAELDGSVSPTYPARVVVPAAITDDTLRKVCAYRSRGRIPAVSFVHLESGGVIARCAQPLTGQATKAFIGNRRSMDDEALCAQLIQPYSPSGPSLATVQSNQSAVASSPKAKPPSLFFPPPSLLGGSSSQRPSSSPPSRKSLADEGSVSDVRRVLNITDCRSKAAATANRAKGGGYEDTDNYDRSRIFFYNMDNIHAVTASWRKLRALIQSSGANNATFYSQLEATQWLYHMQLILHATVKVCDMIANGECVLVHCSDGWDRTAMLCSLAMLLLDPYYRTARGFFVLIEKEWCTMGHKFAERLAHQVPGTFQIGAEGRGNEMDIDPSVSASHGGSVEPSPVFMQFLDAVYQLIRQFPNAFEFTQYMLMDISHHAFSCRYGTFLGNFDRERVVEGIKSSTVSLWTDLDVAVRRERRKLALTDEPLRYLNRHYDPKFKYAKPLFQCVSVSHKRLVLWEDNYLRYDTDAVPLHMHMQEPADVRLGPAPVATESTQGTTATSTPTGDWPSECVDDDTSDDEVTSAVERRRLEEQLSEGGSVEAMPRTVIHRVRVQKDAKMCSRCDQVFSWRLRRHSCRRCQNVFCDECCHWYVTGQFGATLRVCESCHAIANVERKRGTSLVKQQQQQQQSQQHVDPSASTTTTATTGTPATPTCGTTPEREQGKK
eukprot:PhM_4_TR2054/c0_g1_i1/m.10158/K18081/MTMR1_2; myotubularin-related protein 1/2